MRKGEEEGTVWVIEEEEVRVEDWRVFFLFGCMYGSEVVIMGEDTDVEVEVGVVTHTHTHTHTP